ncbi:2'-5' RNA ligase family protein [Rossellomorea vietnamensis]|uniref:2'-5' RNA ligase family protein n=1 Tax=Rossellomorea vietnamensis TaxID=218284 RepID=A0A5D4NWC5_9BACI|nr:2'-5' RNA ligase family protein [Rossellomorea vietnamensis]TYS18653.1 2'-5' RNA ligase family protein [Rossellomorea vietnamensis]
MYGLIALFDEKTEKTVRGIWKELKEQSISDYAYEVIDRIPHITLASCRSIKEDAFIERMEEVYQSQKPVDITFNSLGSFMKSGSLFLSPVVTEELPNLHRSYYEGFKELKVENNPLYESDKWVPHCTLANRLSAKKLAGAFTYCSTNVGVVSGAITDIALIKVQGDTAPVIHSIKLKP